MCEMRNGVRISNVLSSTNEVHPIGPILSYYQCYFVNFSFHFSILCRSL